MPEGFTLMAEEHTVASFEARANEGYTTSFDLLFCSRSSFLNPWVQRLMTVRMGWKNDFPGRKQEDVEKMMTTAWAASRQRSRLRAQTPRWCVILWLRMRLKVISLERNQGGNTPLNAEPHRTGSDTADRENQRCFPQRRCCQRKGHRVPAEGEAHGRIGMMWWQPWSLFKHRVLFPQRDWKQERGTSLNISRSSFASRSCEVACFRTWLN